MKEFHIKLQADSAKMSRENIKPQFRLHCQVHKTNFKVLLEL